MSKAVLVVDDVSDWRIMVAGLIEDIYPDCTVVTAASQAEAKKQLVQYSFDLAIIDIRLNESDKQNTEGLDLMEFIRSRYDQTQVLIITSYPNLETVKKALRPNQSGLRPAVDYLEKDKFHEELLPRISAILGEPQ
jgi:CheY-like chemotaxis protein